MSFPGGVGWFIVKPDSCELVSDFEVLVEWYRPLDFMLEVGSSRLGESPTRKGGKRAKLPFRGTTFQIYSTAITMKYI